MTRTGIRGLAGSAIALGLLAAFTPASAQWTRVGAVPAADIFSVWTKGDTIVAASDSTVFVSTNAGTSWKTSATVAPGATMVEAVRVHRGLLYAGTFGQGVFVSHDLGSSWQGFNQGLVGGFADSQLRIMDLLPRGDTLYAATAGAGAWIRNLTAGGWSHYGNALEPAQAGSVNALAISDSRLLACAGVNGDIYHRDPGDADWSFDYLLNGTVAAGLESQSAIWTGRSWLVTTNIGVFHSAAGQSPWTYFDFGLHPTFFSSLALHDGVVFTHFANGEGTGIEYSSDDGATWQVLDAQLGIFTYKLATLGSTLYAGRVDGLWSRSIATVAVRPGPAAAGLRLSLAGPSPVRDQARFRLELPAAGRVRMNVFDVAGRLAAGGIDETLPAGVHEVAWDARALAPGIYLARLSAAGQRVSVRFVRVR